MHSIKTVVNTEAGSKVDPELLGLGGPLSLLTPPNTPSQHKVRYFSLPRVKPTLLCANGQDTNSSPAFDKHCTAPEEYLISLLRLLRKGGRETNGGSEGGRGGKEMK